MLTTIISFIIVLGVLVFFHELGHYWVARRNGVVVEEFGLGYPPRLVKLFRYDGTDFTLNLLPLGGFARMKGEDAGDMAAGSFNAAGRGARAAILAAGPAMNALLAILLFAASFMAGFPQVAALPQLTTVAAGSPAEQLDLQPGDVLISLNGRPLHVSAMPEMSSKMLPDTSQPPAPAQGVTVGRQGATIQVETGDLSQQQLLSGVEYIPVAATQVGGTAPDSPAALAGIQPGDLVYAVDGAVITASNPLNALVQEKLGEEVTLTLLRGDEWLDVSLTPRASPPPGEGALGVQIGPVTALATLSFWPALWQGARSTWDYVTLVLQLPVLLLTGALQPADAQISGPVGIAQMVGGAVSATIDTGLWFPILRLSAVLSAALAITNLLPLPALDGGRLLFIAIEALRGRRVSPEREGLVHMIGFMLLLGLLVIVTVQDIRSSPDAINWLELLGR